MRIEILEAAKNIKKKSGFNSIRTIIFTAAQLNGKEDNDTHDDNLNNYYVAEEIIDCLLESEYECLILFKANCNLCIDFYDGETEKEKDLYKYSDLKKDDRGSNRYWRSEPTSVAKLADELWIGVKDRKSTRLNSSHSAKSRMPSSA